MPPPKRLRVSSQAEQKPRPTWQDIFLEYPIYNRICHYLSRSDIVALKATSRRLQGPLDTLLKSQWDINKLLKRFVENPVALRQKMAEADALISGSFGLQFFDRVVWEDSDLDIYVKGQWEDAGPNSFCEHLVQVEGYTLKNTMEMEDYQDQVITISGVKTFTRINSEGCSVDIQIILTIKTPILMILTSFYTTALINFISWDCAYSVFPDVTFIKRKTYQLRPMTPFYGNLLMKYSRRGWRTLDTVWDDDREHTKSLVFNGERRVGDSRSWKIPLNTDGLVFPDLINTSNLEYSFFEVEKVPESSGFPKRRARYEVFAVEFVSCVLKQKYTYPCVGRVQSFFYNIGHRLEDLTAFEVDKQPHNDAWTRSRYVEFYFIMADGVRDSPPDGWTFWDQELPKWFDAFQKRLADSDRNTA